MDLPKVIVLTATTGNPLLKNCIESVQKQTYTNLQHILVCDGAIFQQKVQQIIESINPIKNLDTMVIPWNSGANGYVCHKIYASIPHLIHEPCYISFLDEDNTINENHIEMMFKTINETKCTWTYCLRNIISPSGDFICRDLCESLGKLHSTFISRSHSPDYLVDTSSYLVPVEIARKFSECWQRPARSNPEGDRYFYECLSKHYRNFECTINYSLNYRVDSRDDSVKSDFFLLGNSIIKNKLNIDKIPWDI
jgi:hypothetical protein